MANSIIYSIITIGLFIYIYKKYKVTEEKYLPIKLIGYYMLGAFRFNYNDLAIPLGFIIYLSLFKNKSKLNKKAKGMAALLGLIVLIVGLITPMISKAYFERIRTIEGASNSIYDIDFEKNLEKVRNKMEITDRAKIENLRLEFIKDGSIIYYGYDIIDNSAKDGYVLYRVRYEPEENTYEIEPTKIETWLQYPRLVRASKLTKVLNKLKDYGEIKPYDNFEEYYLHTEGWWENYAIEDRDTYLVNDNGIRKLSNKDLPIEGGYIGLFGKKKIGERNFINEGKRDYIFSY